MSAVQQLLLIDGSAAQSLGPIAHTRPCFEIRVGALNLRERAELAFGAAKIRAAVREPLRPLLAQDFPELDATRLAEQVHVLDGRVVAAVESLQAELETLSVGEALVDADGVWIAACLPGIAVEGLLRDGLPDDCRTKPLPDAWVRAVRPWEWIPLNDTMLVADHETLRTAPPFPRRIFGVRFEEGSSRAAVLGATAWADLDDVLEPGAIAIGRQIILVGAGSRVRPGAVLDAEKGPIVLSAGCVVHPLSVIVGPAYLGPGTVVNPGAKLREGTSLGAHCKVGGEIEESIVLDLSNKQHDGFLGHAVMGSWVNLGADTNGSDLKNNYGPVRVDLGGGGEDTGSSFVGPHFGDHAKTGIDTMLTTGGVVGVAANVFGGGFAPRHVPSFSWGGSDGLGEYRLEAALDTARTVFARRGARWTREHAALIETLFAAGAEDRRARGVT